MQGVFHRGLNKRSHPALNNGTCRKRKSLQIQIEVSNGFQQELCTMHSQEGKKLSRFVDAHGQKGMMGVRRVQKSSQKVLTANSTLIMGIGIFCPYFLVGREIKR